MSHSDVEQRVKMNVSTTQSRVGGDVTQPATPRIQLSPRNDNGEVHIAGFFVQLHVKLLFWIIF